MTEEEWRGLGIQMSAGWQHYGLVFYLLVCCFFLTLNCALDWHAPEPHVLLFRRTIAQAEANNRLMAMQQPQQ